MCHLSRQAEQLLAGELLNTCSVGHIHKGCCVSCIPITCDAVEAGEDKLLIVGVLKVEVV